jgi:hypothetical protein
MGLGSSNRRKPVAMRREEREPVCPMFVADGFVLQMGKGMAISVQDVQSGRQRTADKDRRRGDRIQAMRAESETK